MAFTDPIGDMITRIRNGQQRKMRTVRVPKSKLRGSVLDVLSKEGYIRGYTVEKSVKGFEEFSVELKYSQDEGVIHEIKRVSTPGRRVYSKVTDLPRFHNGLGISILSTPQGVISDAQAREANVGGEILCQVF
jgi:small subunit ribosomal protein S8